MIRLIAGDLRATVRLWISAFGIAAGAAIAYSIPASLIGGAIRAGGLASLALASISGVVILFSTLAVAIVAGSSMQLHVAVRRRSFGLWSVVGLSPTAIARVVTTELAAVSLLGTSCGIAIAAAFVPSVVQEEIRALPGVGTVDAHLTAMSALIVVGFVSLFLVGVGRSAARRAGRTPPVALTTGGGREPRPRLTLRVVVAASLAAVVTQMVVTLPGSLHTGGAQVVFIGPLAIGVVAAIGPWLIPAVTFAWTGLIPPSASGSFFMARAAVRQATSRSSGTTVALMVAFAVPMALESGHDTLASATGGGSAPATGAELILSGPILMALIGAAASTFMSSQARSRELALTAAVGGTPRFLVTMTVWECVINLATAAALAVVVIGGCSLVEGARLATVSGSARAALSVAGSAWVAVIAVPILLVATVAPAVFSMRRSVPRALSIES
ncbi:FtsX-like permease family protein [Leifsonia sp. RAF41]|uniref:FtsX-like permease family protein n=1 Tax=Leifsonia sp. RAF41 TaxID=3233056 RepID=UPI003F989B4E